MKSFLLVTAVMFGVFPAYAQLQAQTWKAQITLNKDRSAGSCDNSFGTITLTLAGNELTQVSSTGSTFKFPVKDDGSVDHTYRNSSGGTVRIVGNARTKDLEIVNDRTGCRFKYVPM